MIVCHFTRLKISYWEKPRKMVDIPHLRKFINSPWSLKYQCPAYHIQTHPPSLGGITRGAGINLGMFLRVSFLGNNSSPPTPKPHNYDSFLRMICGGTCPFWHACELESWLLFIHILLCGLIFRWGCMSLRIETIMECIYKCFNLHTIKYIIS